MLSLRLALTLVLTSAVAAVPSAQAGIANDEMTACAALGAKRPGNAAGRAMAARLEQRFRAAGLEVHHEDFHMPVYAVRGVSLQVLSPQPKTAPGETFAYGGAGVVQAEVVDVGTGRESDYSGVDAKGKIVMVDRNEAYHRTSQLTQVLAHGGLAMLYVSGSPDNLIQTGAVRFAQAPPATIPTVTVGKDDGSALRAQMNTSPPTPLKMRIAVDAERTD